MGRLGSNFHRKLLTISCISSYQTFCFKYIINENIKTDMPNFCFSNLTWKCPTTYFGWNCFFLQKWKPFSIIQIVTNFYNSSLNGFKDIWHWKYVVSQGPLFFNAVLLYLDLQQCCIEHFSKTRKYLNAILLYLDLQQCCIEYFSKIKKILKCNTFVSGDTTVLHWTFSLYQENYAMQNCYIFTCIN